MKSNTIKGTNDFLPKEVEIRDFIQTQILETYKNSGFSRITTPILEDIENLKKSEGGDNLNLTFQILKRGEKLTEALENEQFDKLCDIGLRYDLTLPLSRYYSNNKEKLMLPMKCIQIDKVYRAERPQRGRNREFVQCDIDIIGSNSINCEIELIYTAAKALMSVGLNDFIIKINDRRLLKSLLLKIGFDEEKLDSICISIDKIDKISLSGLESNLIGMKIDKIIVDKLIGFLNSEVTLKTIAEIVGESQIIKDLQKIIDSITDLSKGNYSIKFDTTLVRGQGYYTGTIFEIESKKFESSIGGGGRYDNLIEKFTGEEVPAVGFSIGFERIYTILIENGFVIPNAKRKIAFFYKDENFLFACKEAEKYRNEYDVVLYDTPRKLGKFLDKLTQNNFYGFIVYGEIEKDEIKQLKK